MPIPPIPWDDLTDDELADLAHLIRVEQDRRFRLSRPKSWVEEIRDALQQRGGEPT